MPKETQYVLPFRRSANTKAVIFVHGFDEGVRTWTKFANCLLADPELRDWDMYSMGYRSEWRLPLLPSGDHSLYFASRLILTNLTTAPVAGYQDLVLAAHSSGGLVLQRALIDSGEVLARVRQLFLFGTPSQGSEFNPYWIRFGPQLKDMHRKSDFIRDLRKDWNARFRAGRPFQLLAIAAERDPLVKKASVWADFPPGTQRAIQGNHDSMIQPESSGSECVRLVKQGLLTAAAPASPPVSSPAIAQPRTGGFISYSHKDSEYLMDLQEALVPYLGSGEFANVWDDSRIVPGSEWRAEIDGALERARVAVLLVSRHFLASEFVLKNELPYLVEASKGKKVKVLWVAVTASGYTQTAIADLQALNNPERPLEGLTDSGRSTVLDRAAAEIKRQWTAERP